MIISPPKPFSSIEHGRTLDARPPRAADRVEGTLPVFTIISRWPHAEAAPKEQRFEGRGALTFAVKEVKFRRKRGGRCELWRGTGVRSVMILGPDEEA